jgi:hypothetical protein
VTASIAAAPRLLLDEASLLDLSSSMGGARLRFLAQRLSTVASVDDTQGSGYGFGAAGAGAEQQQRPPSMDAAAALEEAMVTLTCLDTASTWVAAERCILATIRFVCQMVGTVLKAVKLAADDTHPDHLNGDAEWLLRAATLLFFAGCLLAFGSACGAYIVYRDWLTLPKEQLCRQLFGLDPKGRVAASNLMVALLGALSGVFALVILIKRLLA